MPKVVDIIRTIRDINSIYLFQQGREAIAAVPKLKSRVAYGFALNLVLYILVAGLALFGYYRLIHSFLAGLLHKYLAGWMATVGNVGLWVLFLAITLVTMILSLRVSLKLMALWYEELVDRVVNHTRVIPSTHFTLKGFMAGLGQTLLDIAREIAIALGLFTLGLIPLLGPICVFLITSHLMGRAIMDPYVSVMRGLGEKVDVGQYSFKGTIALGWSQMILALIPLLGWFLLPVSLVHQVLGLAWHAEKKVMQASPSQGEIPVKQ